MAISARQAQLQNQRQNLLGDRRRILAPIRTSVTNVARTAAKNEITVMVDRYNDGLVGNAEMQEFLQRMRVNPGLNQQDLNDLDDQIRDFDYKVRKDKLEAIYRNAPENSLAQIEAAQSLANFYQNRSATLGPDSPAQLTAQENAGIWNQKIIDLQNNAEKIARKNFRYEKEMDAYQNPAGTPERAQQLAQMFTDLANQAGEDGDQTEALRFQSLAQQQMTYAEELTSKLNAKAEAENIKTQIAQKEAEISKLPNGSAEQQQAYSQLYQSVADYYAEAGDEIQYNKYVKRANEYEQKFQKAATSEKASGATSWDTEDYNYSDNLRTIEENFRTGRIDAVKYAELVGKTLADYQNKLNQRISTLEEIASANPNERIYYQGKNQQVSNVLESIYGKYDDLVPQIQAYQNGNFRLMETAPDATTKSGSMVSEYKLIDVNAIPENERDQYTEDSSGIIHKIIREQIVLTPDVMNDPAQVYNGYYTDPNTQQRQPIKYDSAGNPYIYGKSQVDVYKPGTNEKITVDYVPGQNLESWNDYADRTQTEIEAIPERVASAKQKAAELEGERNALMLDQPAINFDRRNILQKTQEAVEPMVQDVTQKVSEAVAPLKTAAKEIVAPVKQAIQTQSVDPLKNIISQSPFSYVAKAVSNAYAPKPTNTVQPSGSGFTTTANPTVNYTPQYQTPANLNLQKATSSGGLTVALQPAKQPSTLSKIATTIKTESPFSWLGKKVSNTVSSWFK